MKSTNTNWRNVPRIIGILMGGLSLFRLSSLLFNLDISGIVELVLTKYNEILKPITYFFGPIVTWLANEIEFEVPLWWPHFFIIWLLVGAITMRAGQTIDERTGQTSKNNFILDLLVTLILSLLGGILLIFAIFLWIRFEIILKMMDIDKSETRYVNPYKVLFRETILTISATIIFFGLNAFTT